MDRRSLMLSLLAAVCLSPVPAAAQAPAPYAAYQRTMADLGTWDVEVVGRDWEGRPFKARAVERNTLGCAGSCIVTEVQGALAAPPVNYNVPWWDALTAGSASGTSTSLHQTGMGQGTVFAGEYPEARTAMSFSTPIALLYSTTVANEPPARVVTEYLKDGRRIVSIYGPDHRGKEVRRGRLTYSRRPRP